MRSLPKIFLLPTIVLILIFGFIAVQITTLDNKGSQEVQLKTVETVIQQELSVEAKEEIDQLNKQIEDLTAVIDRQEDFIKSYEERMDNFQWQLSTYEDRLLEAQRQVAP